MSTRSLSPVEWDIIAARVAAKKEAYRLETDSRSFLWLVLNQHFPDRQDDHLLSITDSGGDRGIDAIVITESDQDARITIYQSKYRESMQSAKKTINADEARKITQFISELHNRSEGLLTRPNILVREAIRRIWALYERGTQCYFEVVFCSNDAGLSPESRDVLTSLVQAYPHVRFSYYGAYDLISESILERRVKWDGQLQAISREIFDRSDGDVRGLIASIDAGSFVNMIVDPDTGGIRRHLFEDNLRVFLGNNAGYNSSIIETASGPNSHLFWYLNNGITITCKRFSYQKQLVSPIIQIQDLQIVNGAQTSHSLVEARARNPEALADVVIAVRIYETDRDDIAERVAVATNSQARIQDRDLRANSVILKKLEASLLEHGYYFERKRGMHADRPAPERIDALKLGQIIQSFYLREPDRARTDSDDIFGTRFYDIFRENLNVSQLTLLLSLYARIEIAREDVLSKFSGAIESAGDYQYLVYGHWFILFACSLILSKESKPIPSGGEADDLVREAIGIVARSCGQNKQVAHYQLFRSSRTKDKVAAEVSGKQLELFVDGFG